MPFSDHTALARALLPCVLEAGAVEMKYFTNGVAIERKLDSSPVTAADRDAELLLIAGLAAAAPGVTVVAEESVLASQVLENGQRFFLVDPLDGTREFIKKSPEFTINIGLVEHGVPVFGIIYAPALSELYMTLGPGQAVMTIVAPGDQDFQLDAARWTPLRTRAANADALVVMESRSHGGPGLEALLAHHKVGENRSAGSSLKFCHVARGKADLYARLGPTCEWDTAAGHAILAAAGGAVLKLDGAPMTYGHADKKFLNPSFMAWGQNAPQPW